jgi:hypothetical protein
LGGHLNPFFDFVDDVRHGVVLNLLHDRIFLNVLVLLTASLDQIECIGTKNAVDLLLELYKFVPVKVMLQNLAEEEYHGLA